ncbi:MAG: hypothetical protein HYU64_15505 [Armatimonadetes bacterium]|nr:hypothetical protein [Armatimonadota bacterium]
MDGNLLRRLADRLDDDGWVEERNRETRRLIGAEREFSATLGAALVNHRVLEYPVRMVMRMEFKNEGEQVIVVNKGPFGETTPFTSFLFFSFLAFSLVFFSVGALLVFICVGVRETSHTAWRYLPAIAAVVGFGVPWILFLYLLARAGYESFIRQKEKLTINGATKTIERERWNFLKKSAELIPFDGTYCNLIKNERLPFHGKWNSG